MDSDAHVKPFIDKLAGTVRFITVPPVMILALLIMLYYLRKDLFEGRTDMIIGVTGLVLLPLAAYPVHRLIPKLHEAGREMQRKIAFIFSLAGYALCFAYALFRGTVSVKLIYFTYFITVVILTVFNKLLKIRASGHTASSLSPCFFAFYFGFFSAGIVFAIVFCTSVWASLYLKRHKVVDVSMGVVSFIISFAVARLCTGFLI